MSEPTRWVPLGMQYRVVQMPAPEKTAAGIYLPQGTPLEATEGRIVARGNGNRPFQARVGERVLFERENLAPVGETGEGLLGEEDLIAIRMPAAPGLQPANDWLLVKLAHEQETAGGLLVPERWQRHENGARVLDYGPGEWKFRHGIGWSLRSVSEMLGREPWGDVRGLLVYWKKDARMIEILGAERDLYLVRATDLVAVDEEDDDGTGSGGAVPAHAGRSSQLDE